MAKQRKKSVNKGHDANLRSRFVVLSGLDGAGKSTQIELLRKHLQNRGVSPECSWGRGGYTPGMTGIKRLMRHIMPNLLPPPGESKQRAMIMRRSWLRVLWLYAAILDLIFYYGVRIRWQRLQGKFVICDRYVWDTLIDFQLNYPEEKVAKWKVWKILDRIAPEPDHAFILTVPVEESIRRSQEKNEPFPDPDYVLHARLDAYINLHKRSGWPLLDGREAKERLLSHILAEIHGGDMIGPGAGCKAGIE